MRRRRSLRAFLRRRLWRVLRWLDPYPDAANHPDLPSAARGWLIHDTGHWGTLASTPVGFDRVLLGTFKGYDQTSGVMLTRDQVRALLESGFDLSRGEGVIE